MIGWYSCLCSTTMNGQRKAIQKLVCTMPKMWQHLRPNCSMDTGASWSPRQKYVVERKFQRTSIKKRCCSHCTWLTYSSVILPTQYFQRQSHYRLDSGGKEEAISRSMVHTRTRRFSSRPYWQAICDELTIEFASEMRLKSSICTENSGRWRTNRFGTRAADIFYAKNSKQCHKLEATRCNNPQRITRRWFGELSNRQNLPERWKIDSSKLTMNLLWMEENTQSQGILNIQDYKLFLTITSRSGQWQELTCSNLQELWL